MLNKLFRLDFKWVMNKVYFIYVTIGLISAGLARMFEVTQSPFGSFMRHFMSSVAISMCFSIIFSLLVRVIVLFVRNFYRDEAYLTHTLPVTKTELWNAKVLTVAMTIGVATLSVAIILAVAFLNTEMWGLVKHIAEEAGLIMVGPMILTVLLETLDLNLAIFAGILVGRKADTRKTLRAVVAATVFYIIPQLVLLGGVYILSRFNTTYAALFAETGTTSPELIKSVLYITVPFYLALNIGLYFIGRKTLERGVDVE